MVATATASYFLLTADYGPEPNALDPVWFVYVFIFVVLIPTLHVSYMLKALILKIRPILISSSVISHYLSVVYAYFAWLF